MGPKPPHSTYHYVVTPAGPKILPVDDPLLKDEESPVDYNTGGYLPVKLDDTFKGGRYQVVRKLGWGHFSTVWLVKDSQTNLHSALKIVKSAGRYAETARDEIKLLSRVASVSPSHLGRSHIVSFLDSFSHQALEASHICIVFEPLGENLLSLLERNKKKGVPRAIVKVIIKQILLGLQYLHDECDLVHTDIKPENILISIPDIETHISSELSQSPSPISCRVGVPLPTKLRAGVFIPNVQQRARRQVQIFNSQPLASPGRSVDKPRNGHASTSITASHGNSGSGSNSADGSYVAQLQLSRLNGSGSNTASGTAKSLSSGASKLPTGLSTSAPRARRLPSSKSDSRLDSKLIVPTGSSPKPIVTSTSSSSSSVASTLASTITVSSMVSTPPTSLSYSFGNAMGFMGLSETGDRTYPDDSGQSSDDVRKGLPVIGKKGRTIDDQLEHASSISWRDSLGIPSSWRDKLSTSISSSYALSCSNGKSRPIPVQSNSHSSHGHSRTSSAGFWKDPGTAAPAPAVVVSAVVSAGGEEGAGNYFDLAHSASVSSTTSASSSATATIVRPSRDGTPNRPDQSPSKKDISTSNTARKLVSSTYLAAGVAERPSINPSSNSSNSAPSLLTQTAPPRTPIGPLRSSPPHHVSQLSAHLHSRPSMSQNSSDLLHTHNITHKTHVSHNSHSNIQNPPNTSITTSFTSLTLAPAISPPPAPPPTPVTSSSISSFLPGFVPIRTAPIPISDSERSPEPDSPPISIKIADLGNATPSRKHFTEEIQTRQYRAPEAILGKSDWDTTVDIWSVACVAFELLTGEFLFDPHGQGEVFNKDDDHLAQIIELLGDFPLEVKMGGKHSRELFDHTGSLRYIRTLKPWPLKRVMIEKYLYSEADSVALCKFLLQMLAVDRRKRAHARDMIDHAWLIPTLADDVVGDW